MLSRLPFFVLVFFVTPALAWAQAGGSNPQNSLLPEINPQDIEIRSEFRARFPGLRRQPILGFNPKPRVFQIDPNRMPFMETRDQAVANIAITQLDRPEPPARSIIQAPPRRNILLRAGFGSFTTPEASAYFFEGLNEKSALSGNIDFSASDGHLDNQLSGFRFLDGDVRFTSKINRELQTEVNLGFVNDFNRLYNLAPIYQDVIGSTARKEYSGLNGRVSVQQIKNALEGITGEIGFQLYNSEIDAGGTDLTGKSNEQFISAGLTKYWPGKRVYETFSISGNVTAGTYENSVSGSENMILAGVDGEYKKLIDFNLHVSAKAGAAYVSDGISNRVYLAPEALVTYNLKDALILKGGIFGTPDINSLQDHYQTNRFLNTETVLRHSYQSGGFAEVAFQLIEGNRLYSGFKYSITKNYGYYDREIETRIGVDYPLFYELKYERATDFEFYGGITQQLKPEQFWFDFRFYGRRPKLDSGGDIPFEERLGVNSSISFKPTKALLLRGWLDFVGSRQSPSTNEELDAFTVASFSADYEITPRFGVYAKVLNILGQKYELWDGYEERPFQVFGGLILKL